MNWMELEIQPQQYFKKEKKLSHENSSDLQWVKVVEDHLQERTKEHSEGKENNQDDDVVVGIIFLSPCTDGLHQKLMSFIDIESWDKKSM